MIEISPEGGAVTYSEPSVFTPEGASAIAVARPDAAAAGYDVALLLREAAKRQNLSVELLSEVARRESGFRQSAVSHRGAVGVMQLMAGTARALGVDRHDAAQNVHGGAAYLRSMLDRYGGDQRLALAAYNAGPGAVDRYGGIPPYRETQAYVAAILSRVAKPIVAVSTTLNHSQ